MSKDFDAHAKPPAIIREAFKKLQKHDIASLILDPSIVDLARKPWSDKLVQDDRLNDTWQQFHIFIDQTSQTAHVRFDTDLQSNPRVNHSYEVEGFEGLVIYPCLFPPSIQSRLLDQLLHRDLLDARHKTNVHLHYHISYPVAGNEQISFFDSRACNHILEPKDPSLHKPISTRQFLGKKLRWMTLGGQYDWTNKTYPAEQPLQFPADIKALIDGIFPMKAEAAIVNSYSPGDTLSLHRDVSEECDQPLVSISIGCDCIFVVGLGDDLGDVQPRTAAIRLHSGDAVLMRGESRYAWHGVAKVLSGTCPDSMKEWPMDEQYNGWRGWLGSKRINVNVRQMFNG